MREDLKTALVTGASLGLGEALAAALAARGMDLVITARGAARLEAVAERLRAHGGRVVALPADLSEPQEARRLAAEATEALGAVDLLINNAGGAPFRPFHLTRPEELEYDLRLNLTAPILLTHALLPGMLRRGRGHVVCVASMIGVAGFPNSEAYSAAKEGLIAFTRTLRADYRAKGVSASAVVPGWIMDIGGIPRAMAERGLTKPRFSLKMGVTGQQVVEAALRLVDLDQAQGVVVPGPGGIIRALMAGIPAVGPAINRLSGAATVAQQYAESAVAGEPLEVGAAGAGGGAR